MFGCRIIFAVLLGLATTSLALADTLASASPGGLSNVSPNYLGEAFTVTGTGNYNSIVFSFLTPTGSVFASGTGFLLSQAYTGTPGALSSSTAGYLGSAAATGNAYSFDSSVQLSAGSNYYFYENALIATGTIAGATTSTPFPYFYYAPSGGSFTAQPLATAAFRVTGTQAMTATVTPEPSSFALLGTGLLSVAGVLRRRFSA